MSKRNEETVRAMLNGFHVAKPDFANLVSRYFADNAQYQPLVPMRAPAIGRDGIRAELERQYQFYNDCACTIHAIAASETHVFSERTDTVTLNHDGKRVETRLNAVFDIDADGLIGGWREYYDSGDLIKKLGLTMEQFEQVMAAN